MQKTSKRTAAKEITVLRERLGLSQLALSNLAGLTLNGICRMEGARSNPKMSTLEKIAKCVGHEVVVSFVPRR